MRVFLLGDATRVGSTGRALTGEARAVLDFPGDANRDPAGEISAAAVVVVSVGAPVGSTRRFGDTSAVRLGDSMTVASV